MKFQENSQLEKHQLLHHFLVIEQLISGENNPQTISIMKTYQDNIFIGIILWRPYLICSVCPFNEYFIRPCKNNKVMRLSVFLLDRTVSAGRILLYFVCICVCWRAKIPYTEMLSVYWWRDEDRKSSWEMGMWKKKDKVRERREGRGFFHNVDLPPLLTLMTAAKGWHHSPVRAGPGISGGVGGVILLAVLAAFPGPRLLISHFSVGSWLRLQRRTLIT